MRRRGAGIRAVPAAAAMGIVLLAALAACSVDAHMGTGAFGRAALQSVAPTNGATGVSIGVSMTMRFSDAMGSGTESYVAVHEGTLAGPVVAGRWSWSPDRRTLTFAPDASLRPHTPYVIHMGGGMRDARGDLMDSGSCRSLGGQSVGAAMMGSGGGGMMGAGWQSSDGGYGMFFVFTTA